MTRFSFWLAALGLVCVGLAQAPEQSSADLHIELTQVDLFSRSEWNSKQVAVRGFYLGMPR